MAISLSDRRAWIVAVAVLGALVGVYAVAAVGRPWAAVAVPVAVALFVLQLRYVLAPLRRFRTWPWMGAQVALHGLAVLWLGFSVAVLGLLVGALLLERARVAAVLVAVAAPVIVVGRGGTPREVLDYAITTVLMALVAVGLSRLIDRIDEVGSARISLAMAAVEEERLRMAAGLNEGIGRGLDTIAAARGPADLDRVLDVAREALAGARSAATELRSLSLTPELSAARGLLAAADVEAAVRAGHREPLGQAGALLAAVLREAVTDAVRQGGARHCVIETEERGGLLVLRVASDGFATVARGAEALAGVAARVRAVGGRLDTRMQPDGWFVVEAAVAGAPAPTAEASSAEHRLSVALLAAVLAGFCAKGLLLMTPWQALFAVPPLAMICLLQLRWVGRGWALCLQAVLSYVPILWLGQAWGGAPGFLVGSLLVVLPAAVAWPLTAGVMASMGVIAWALGHGAAVVANSVISVLVTGLVVYGLVRLAALADELRAAGAGMARAAVVQERLRAARDLHDLLGHSLAAVLLKGEIARRLAVADPDRARQEFADLVRMAVQARRDMATVTGAAPRLEFGPELASARSVLGAAGIEVRVVQEEEPVEGAVFSTVLREAVTNVLRHSAASYCEITVRAAELVVENDGCPDEITPPGAGIGNLATRLGELGGRLDARPVGDGRFRVVAALDPAGLAGDADGVGASPGVQLGDDRREVVADGPGRQV
ncbi:histidine kinase [Spirillospora sp. NPDC029432]|uniref:sensor histidine kinase n=1 Tax=Spirillospora sp. NPDC029432 TaxID=3154599 RepID=UPI003455EC18